MRAPQQHATVADRALRAAPQPQARQQLRRPPAALGQVLLVVGLGDEDVAGRLQGADHLLARPVLAGLALRQLLVQLRRCRRIALLSYQQQLLQQQPARRR